MRPPTPLSTQNCPLEALSRSFMASGDQSLDTPEVMFDLKRSKVTSRTSKETSRTSNDAPRTSNDRPDTSNDRSGRSNDRSGGQTIGRRRQSNRPARHER